MEERGGMTQVQGKHASSILDHVSLVSAASYNITTKQEITLFRANE